MTKILLRPLAYTAGPRAMGWKIVLVVAASLFLVAACGGRTTSTTEDGAGEPTATTGSTSTSPGQDTSGTGQPGQPLDGGTFFRLLSDPPTLDPHKTTDSTSATVIVEVFGGLVTIDPNLKVVGDLAKDWEISPDGTTYTFFLREDAKFHDGKPVTAQDFKWSIERVSDPLTASPVVDQYLGDIVGVKDKLRGDASDVRGVRVVNNHTLELKIDAAKSYFLAKLTYPTAFVLDRENVESGRRWFRKPNGTGPFKLEEYLPGERLVLARNDLYHLGAPHLDRVRFILSGGTAMLMYENDEIHVTGVGIADLDRILDPKSSLNPQLIQAPPSFSTDYIGLNTNEPPFDDIKVRQALNYAIDKKEIARVILADLVVPANGILPPEFPGHNEDVKGYDYDPVKAKRLLEESTYGPGQKKLPPIILTTAGQFGSSVGLDMEVILESWRLNLGIQVEIQQTEFATYLQDLIKRRFQMFQIGWIADYPDPENFLDILFHSESKNNHTGFSNEQVNKLLEQARVEKDEAKRFQLYSQAEQLILDQAPWVPLWYSGEQYVLIKPYVHDYFLAQLIIPKMRFVYMTEK